MEKINRSRCCVVGWMLVGALFSLTCGAGTESTSVPNVVLISLDTLSADHLGLYGYAQDTSPVLDRFADGAVVFGRAIAQSNSTLSSHRSLFQSKYPSVALRDSTMLAEILAEAGYRTAGFTGGGNVAATFGFGRGFEVYEEHDGGLKESLPQVQRWLDEVAGAPFFLFLHTYEIHLPYDAPAPFDKMFYPEYDGKVTGANSREILRRVRGLDESEKTKPQDPLTAADRRKIVALYDGGIRSVDQQLAGLFADLEKRKLLDDSLVIVLSDHGEEFWDHGSVIHSHTLFQELVRVPLLMRFPAGAHGGTRVLSTAMLLDVSPTILDIVGLPVSPSFTGRSMLPAIRGSDSSHRKVLSEGEMMRSWINYPWKLIVSPRERSSKLFNLEDDPAERQNLHRARPERVKAMNEELGAAVSTKSDLSRVKELEDGDIDEELKERLRALGYID